MPFVTLGLVPEAASSLLLPMLSRLSPGRELLLLGSRSPPRGARCGIVNRDRPLRRPAGARVEPQRALQRCASSVRMTKALMKTRYGSAVREAMASEGEKFRAQLGSAEAKEAMQAFFEKRKARFSRF